MKKSIIALFLVCIVLTVNAQNYYSQQARGYYVTTDVNGVAHGYYYDYDNIGKRTKIYNVSNKFVNVDPKFKDGSPMRGEVGSGRVSSYDYDPQIRQKVSGIIYNTLTPEQRELIKGHDIRVRMLVDTNTGKVGEVEFSFSERSPFNNIPIDFYSKVELAIRNSPEITFKLTDVGRTRNYLPINWYWEPKPEGQLGWE